MEHAIDLKALIYDPKKAQILMASIYKLISNNILLMILKDGQRVEQIYYICLITFQINKWTISFVLKNRFFPV